jgi:phage-related protein
VSPKDKPLVWIDGELLTPPLSSAARIEAGYLLRRLQAGEKFGLPHSRPMPDIGRGCHELRINDETVTWRVFYAIEPLAIVILGVESKKTQSTPKSVLDACRRRIIEFRRLTHE